MESLQYVFSISLSSSSPPSPRTTTPKSTSTTLPRPKIPQGRCVVFFDHAYFLNELESYKRHKGYSNSNSSFGAFLCHRPQFGLVAMNCAIALMMITSFRHSIISQSNVNTALSPLHRESSNSVMKTLKLLYHSYQIPKYLSDNSDLRCQDIQFVQIFNPNGTYY